MSWNCTLCTFQNQGGTFCVMCNQQRIMQQVTFEQKNQSPPFEAHMSLSEAHRLRVNDKIDHRDKSGKCLYAIVSEKKGTNLKIHYDGWSEKWDVWSDYTHELYRFAKAGSISRRPAHIFTDLKKYSFVKINPKREHSGWTDGQIKRLDTTSGQVLVAYQHQVKHQLHCSYWTHLDDISEISESTFIPLTYACKSPKNNSKLVTINLKQYCPMEKLLNMDKNQKMIIKNVQIANLKWNVIIFPNGNILDSYNKDTFIIGLDLLTMPSEWKEITCFQTIEFVQKKKKTFSFIKTYDKKSGWQGRVMLLSKLKGLKPSTISIQISMNILSVVSKNDSNILYQFNDQKFINKFINNSVKKFSWNFNDEMIDNFIRADQNQMKPFITQMSDDGMWRILMMPDEDNDVWSSYWLHLQICYLPPNVKTLEIKFTLQCNEINVRFQTTHTFSYNSSYYSTHLTFRRPELKQIVSLLPPLKLKCDMNILSVTVTDGQKMQFGNWKKYFVVHVLGNSEKYGIMDYEKVFIVNDKPNDQHNFDVAQQVVDTLRAENNEQNDKDQKQDTDQKQEHNDNIEQHIVETSGFREDDNKINDETSGPSKQFEKFLTKHRLEKYYKNFEKNECADIRDIKYLIDDEFLQNDINIKVKIHRRKFIMEATELTKQMDSFKNPKLSLIPAILTQKLADYGVVTMDIMCEEVTNKSDLRYKFNIQENKQCDLLWNVVQKQFYNNDMSDMNQQEGL
eukprot:502805_1